MKLYNSLGLLCCFILLSGCLLDEEISNPNAEVPLGQVWASIENINFRFDRSTLPVSSNKYDEPNRYTVIYRQTSEGYYGTIDIQFLNLRWESLDNFPADVSRQARMKFSPRPNISYEGRGEDIVFTIDSFENDIIKGSFEATLRHTTEANEAPLRLRMGRLHIRLDRVEED
ncbi:MAG: hypothetical protein JJT94_05265 [Bernardetiaceae bacterium]|nr:hypothetical protein [Bernardetiaceae bacterium]